MTPRFSIVIPTYNRATSVSHTLSGCFAQTFDNFEVIVVDDGSSDNTLEVLDSIQDSRLVVVSQENAGPAAARNAGMDAACGEYIAFLDSDDVWHPDYLATANQSLAEKGEVALYGQLIVDRGVGRYWIKPDRALGAEESIYDYLYIDGGFIQTSTIIMPASLKNTVRWDEAVTYGDNDQFAIDLWHTGIAFHMQADAQTLYADAISNDALSQLPIYAGDDEKHTNFFRWMETQRDHMSETAWLAYRARFMSVGLARKAPLASISMIWKAYRAGGMRLGGVARQLMQNHTPRLYRKIVDQYVRWRGQPLTSLER